jgi:hypothetical protein
MIHVESCKWVGSCKPTLSQFFSPVYFSMFCLPFLGVCFVFPFLLSLCFFLCCCVLLASIMVESCHCWVEFSGCLFCFSLSFIFCVSSCVVVCC